MSIESMEKKDSIDQEHVKKRAKTALILCFFNLLLWFILSFLVFYFYTIIFSITNRIVQKIVGLLMDMLPSIVVLVVGSMILSYSYGVFFKIKNNPGQYPGKAIAMSAFVLGCIEITLALVIAVYRIYFFIFPPLFCC